MNISEKNHIADRDVNLFLTIGKIEGYSFLVLLFIAMPLKYFLNQPLAVRYVGMIHGVLFVAFIYTILVLFHKKTFSFLQSFKAFGLSILPFGTFYLKKLLKEVDHFNENKLEH